MIKVSDAYSLEDLCEMNEEDMATLLRFYEPDKVPRMGCLKAMEGEFDAFDGSFGFCVGFGWALTSYIYISVHCKGYLVIGVSGEEQLDVEEEREKNTQGLRVTEGTAFTAEERFFA
jgi:hypothetical protein